MNIYCSGIGGIGLSAYASLQKLAGHEVCGSDRTATALTRDLESQGITIFLDQSGESIPGDCDLFVYSEAISVTAPERRRASELGTRQISYPQALGELCRDHRAIAVCGTHGKSSTTAMAARLLIECGRDPSVVVGTKMQELSGRNWRRGQSDLFLLEACEYRRSFLHYRPSIILLTTCDGDHFDYFTDLVDYHHAFEEFVSLLQPEGILITHRSDLDCDTIAKRTGRRTVNADTWPLPPLGTPGEHMRRNAQLVLALGDVLGIATEDALRAVSGYSGSWRRMEVCGTWGGSVTVIDDYAHHPREIRSTLEALRQQYGGRRLVTVFQPHTHDRTRKLYRDFVTAFSDTDVLIVPGVYDARSDHNTEKVDTARFVADAVKESNVTGFVTHSLDEAEHLLKQRVLEPGDVLICMGAGDITTLAARMVTVKNPAYSS